MNEHRAVLQVSTSRRRRCRSSSAAPLAARSCPSLGAAPPDLRRAALLGEPRRSSNSVRCRRGSDKAQLRDPSVGAAPVPPSSSALPDRTSGSDALPSGSPSGVRRGTGSARCGSSKAHVRRGAGPASTTIPAWLDLERVGRRSGLCMTYGPCS
jgi:hypothetical protein